MRHDWVTGRLSHWKKVHKRICLRNITFLAAYPPSCVIFVTVFVYSFPFFSFFSSKNCCENKEGGSGGGGSWCLLLSPSVYGSAYINMLPELEHWNRRYKWYCQVEVAVIVFQCSQISISYAIVKVNQF